MSHNSRIPDIKRSLLTAGSSRAWRHARGSHGAMIFWKIQLIIHRRPVKQAVSADKGMILNAVLAN
jgi:hypothetical protein